MLNNFTKYIGYFFLVYAGTVSAEEYRKSGQLCALWSQVAGESIYFDSTSGERILDMQLSLESHRLAELFGVNPGLRIIAAPRNHSFNALALSDTLIKGTQGTVAVGRDLLFSELSDANQGWGGLVVAGVLAHEFAHIFQFFSEYHARLSSLSSTVEPVELHADFLAGYHLGIKRYEGAKMDIKAFMDGAYILGDDNENNKNHHGTSQERRRAVREGYRVGIDNKSIEEAAQIGFETVQQIMQMSFIE